LLSKPEEGKPRKKKGVALPGKRLKVIKRRGGDLKKRSMEGDSGLSRHFTQGPFSGGGQKKTAAIRKGWGQSTPLEKNDHLPLIEGKYSLRRERDFKESLKDK